MKDFEDLDIYVEHFDKTVKIKDLSEKDLLLLILLKLENIGQQIELMED